MTGFRATIPAQGTIQLEDERVRVTRWDFEPGAETGWHTHGLHYVVVPVTDCLLRVTDKEGSREVLMKAGVSYQREKGVEHNVQNAGAAPMSFVEVEIKR